MGGGAKCERESGWGEQKVKVGRGEKVKAKVDEAREKWWGSGLEISHATHPVEKDETLLHRRNY